MSTYRRYRSDEPQRGASMVEFALVVPVLLTLVIGLFSSAMAFDGKMQLTHATREGARYGATVPQTEVFVSGTWASNVRQVVVERHAGNLTPAQVCVALVEGVTPVPVSPAHTTQAGGGACFNDEGGPGLQDGSRRVQVRTQRSVTFDAAFLKQTVNLTARAVARHESLG